jgi:multidrug efflux pump subunit AcrA (membrane-fusion protein)
MGLIVKKLLIVLVGLGALLVTAAYWISPSDSGRKAVHYERRQIEYGMLVDTVSATGQLAPRDIAVAVVSSPLPGQVVKIHPHADLNHYVEANEPLLSLDPSQTEAKLEQARAAVQAAKTNVVRAQALRDGARVALKYQKELVEKDVGQKAKLEEAEFNLKAAEAGLQAARAQEVMAEKAAGEARLALDKTVVRAPVAGYILERKVYVGQMVGPQLPTPLFKIASDLSELEVNAMVAEGDVSKVFSGQEVTFTVYAHAEANTRFPGKVKQVNYLPNSVQGAVFYNTLIEVKNRRSPPSRETWLRVGNLVTSTPAAPVAGLPALTQRLDETWMLRPGMTANVDIIRRRHAEVWKMPIDAVSFQLDEHYQTAAARDKLAEWAQRSDADDWKHVWIVEPGKNYTKPWPIFVRINGVGTHGEPGIKDSQFIEVLEWDPELRGKLDPGKLPEVIISAPPLSKPSIFERPTRIIS